MSTRGPIRVWLLSFLSLCVMTCSVRSAWAQGEGKTLREILAAEQVPSDLEKLHNLDKRITSGAELRDASQFVIAYYIYDPTERLNPPMFIDLYDRRAQQWASRSIESATAKWKGTDVDCLGSAPVHPAEVAVYDLRSKRDVTIFPPKAPTAIRLVRTAQLREFYKLNPEWCNKNNDPCDPEQFDSELEGSVAVDDREKSLAFIISYVQIPRFEGEQKPSGPQQVVYIYRYVDEEKKMEYREMLREESRTRFGDGPLEGVLQPEVLKTIFEQVPARKP